MPTWLIFAALGAIGVTALLVAVLYRINSPATEPQGRPRGDDAPFIAHGGGASRKTDHDADSGSSDGGGADGGGD